MSLTHSNSLRARTKIATDKKIIVWVIHILSYSIFFFKFSFFFAALKRRKIKNSNGQKNYSVGAPYFMGWESRRSRVATFMSSVASCVVSHLISLFHILFLLQFRFFFNLFFLFFCHIHEQCGELCGITPHQPFLFSFLLQF